MAVGLLSLAPLYLGIPVSRDGTRRDTGCLVSRETNYHRDSETKKVVIWADFRRKMPCFIKKSTTPISHGGYHDSKLYIVVQKMRIIRQFARMDKFDENYRPFEVIWYKNIIGFTTMNLSRCLVSRDTDHFVSRLARQKNARKMETLLSPPAQVTI